jgi:hypothetical protein
MMREPGETGETGERPWSAVVGAGRVVEWFGQWPTFHDAEVLEVHLSRGGESWIRIRTWLMSERVDSRGYYFREKEATVTFRLARILDLELADFSSQNVIGSLEVVQTPASIRLALWPIYGLGGYLEAERVAVEVEPLEAGGED